MAIKRLIKLPHFGISIGVETEEGESRQPQYKPLVGAGYGHIQLHQGEDGMSADTYFGSNINSRNIYRLKQLSANGDGSFDESKWMLLFDSIEQAQAAYLANMPVYMFGGIEPANMLMLRRFKRENYTKENLVAGKMVDPQVFRVTIVERSISNGLPLIVEIEGPAEGQSLNHWVNPATGEKVHRQWTAEGFAKGAKVTQSLIDKDQHPLIQYSHPEDDPEITGLEAVGKQLAVSVDMATKRFTSRALLNHKTNNGLEIAIRYDRAEKGLEDYPDYSIRTRPVCEDEENFVGVCYPGDGMPLLWDFLRPYEQPGLPGSKGSGVVARSGNNGVNNGLSNENRKNYNGDHSHCCATLAEAEQNHCNKCKNKLNNTNNFRNYKSRYAGESVDNKKLASGGKNNKTKGEKKMPVIDINPLFLKKLASEPDAEKRALMVDVAAMFSEPDGDEANPMEDPMDYPMDNPNDPLDLPGDEALTPPSEEMKKSDPNGYETAMNGYKENLRKLKVAREAIKQSFAKQQQAQAAKKTQKAQENQTRLAAQLGRLPNGATIPNISKKDILNVLGITEESFVEVVNPADKIVAQKSLNKRLRELHKEAMESKDLLFGHDISDTKKYPPTAVESAFQAALKESSDFKELAGFLKADFLRIAHNTANGGNGANNGSTTTGGVAGESFTIPANGIMTAQESLDVLEKLQQYENRKYIVGENNEIYKGVAYIVKAITSEMKNYDPKGYERFEKNQNHPEVKRRIDRDFKRCVETYGPQALLNYNKIHRNAKEDISSIGFGQMPNYPAVMTALMVVRQWRKSPIWSLIGNAPGIAMRLGQVIGGNGGPMGQFIEVYTENRTQRKDYDAEYIQSASDPQREIGVTHAPHQSFAYQETTRVRWDTELDAFLAFAPLFKDVPTRLLFNLMEELDYYTEQRISTEILRSSDAYKSLTITNETTNIAKTSCWNYTGGTSGITTPDGTYVANGIGWVWLRRGYASSTDTPVYGPVVRAGKTPFLNRATLTFDPSYPVNCNNINGQAQVRGFYNSVSQMGEKINASDADPTFIVLWDVGIVVFLIGSKFDATHMPTFSQYSKVRNVSVFDFTPQTGETTAAVANRLVEQVARMKSTFAKRQTDPSAKTYLLASDACNQSVAAFATHFQGLNQLDYGNISNSYELESDYVVANLRRTLFLSTTEPLYSNDNRAVLGTENMTIYDELMPPVLGNLQEGIVVDQNGNGQYTSQVSRSCTRRALIDTIVPRNPADDSPINFGAAGMYFSTPPTVSGLPV